MKVYREGVQTQTRAALWVMETVACCSALWALQGRDEGRWGVAPWNLPLASLSHVFSFLQQAAWQRRESNPWNSVSCRSLPWDFTERLSKSRTFWKSKILSHESSVFSRKPLFPQNPVCRAGKKVMRSLLALESLWTDLFCSKSPQAATFQGATWKSDFPSLSFKGWCLRLWHIVVFTTECLWVSHHLLNGSVCLMLAWNTMNVSHTRMRV